MQNRLFSLIKHLGLTATRFADEIGVQRSGISHILSGRNQPSFEFLVKTLKRYPEIRAEWLIMGSGKMIKEEKIDPKDDFNINTKIKTTEGKFDRSKTFNSKVTNVTSTRKVILLHDDGTFSEYNMMA
jgi:transcriptional regulator with XRE-family HTH domain